MHSVGPTGRDGRSVIASVFILQSCILSCFVSWVTHARTKKSRTEFLSVRSDCPVLVPPPDGRTHPPRARPAGRGRARRVRSFDSKFQPKMPVFLSTGWWPDCDLPSSSTTAATQQPQFIECPDLRDVVDIRMPTNASDQEEESIEAAVFTIQKINDVDDPSVHVPPPMIVIKFKQALAVRRICLWCSAKTVEVKFLSCILYVPT